MTPSANRLRRVRVSVYAHRQVLALGILAPLLATACIDKGPPKPAVDENYVQANVLTEAPEGLSGPQIDFDGKVLYLGHTIGSKVLRPGGAGSITHYWKILEAPGSNWSIFTHLIGSADNWQNIDLTDMRTGYPSKRWKTGDIIRDEHKFSLPATWTSKTATLAVGLYEKGKSGTAGRMPIVSGPKDSELRAPVFTFAVEGSTATKVRGDVLFPVRRAQGAITLDGLANEESWQNAPMSPMFTDAEGGPPVGANTQARVLWDDENLYVFVQVSDEDVYSEYQNRDDTLWKQDVIEFFIDADRNRRGYIELQINPLNTHFDAWFPRNRGQKHYFDWNSKMRSAVVVHGTVNKRGDRDRGWDLEVAIPLVDVKGRDARMAVNIPPKLGDKWRFNIIRGEKPESKGLAASSWNPITIRDFHALDRMLTLVFADSEGKSSPAHHAEDPPAAEDSERAAEAEAQVEGAGKTELSNGLRGASEKPGLKELRVREEKGRGGEASENARPKGPEAAAKEGRKSSNLPPN